MESAADAHCASPLSAKLRKHVLHGGDHGRCLKDLAEGVGLGLQGLALRAPAGFMFTVALMQPAAPKGRALDRNDSLAGNTSKIVAFELLQSPAEPDAEVARCWLMVVLIESLKT